MFLFDHWWNNRQETGYSFISSTHFMFLMLPFFLMIIILPIRALAQQYGSITGHVYKYSDHLPLKDVDVTAFDDTNTARSGKTGTNGLYLIKDLPINSSYKVCAKKTDPKTGEILYIWECYECSQPDCGFYYTDPNITKIKITSPSPYYNVDFYLIRGGKIKGDISGVLEESPDPKWDIDYKVILGGNIEYKNKDPLSWEFTLNKDLNNHYYNPLVIPPGKYTIRAEDSSYLKDGTPLPYYYIVYYDGSGGTYIKQNATVFTFQLDKTPQYTANFSIKKGGIIYGYVKEIFLSQYIEIPQARIAGTEKSLGLIQSTQTRTIQETDTNTVITHNGFFSLSGLPPGSYILRTDDTPIADQNVRIYLPEYYDNVYFEDKATPITIYKEDISDPDYQGIKVNDIILQHGPVIKGWAIKHDPNMCGSDKYDSENALKGITIELIPNFQSIPKEPSRETKTDTNGYYIFQKSDKIFPGSYKIRAKDNKFAYFPTAYQTITVKPDKTYNVYFCMKKVLGEGIGNISGHVFLNENPSQPLPGITIRLQNLSGHFQDTNTNNNGEYFFNDLDPGQYILSTSEKLFGNLIHELYKDVSMLDPNFEEGKLIVNTISTEATNILLLPGHNLTNVDIGLSSYQYTFGSGLNLFGYPGLPVEKYNDSYEFCSMLGTQMRDFRWKTPETDKWDVTRRNLSNPTQPLGDKIKIQTGRGYLIYMYNNKGPIFIPPFKTQPPSLYQLVPGKNFIAYPSSLHRSIKRSSELLTAFGTQEEIASVQSFDNTSGKWKSTVWVWGKPGASDFPIVQGGGYLVEMRSYNTVETDPPNITP